MQPLVSARPAAKVMFVGSLVLFMVVQLRVAGAGLRRRLQAQRTQITRLDRGTLLLVTATTGLGVGGAFLSAAMVPSATITGVATVRWLCVLVGAAAIVCGSLGRQWAIHTLGRFFTLDVQVGDGQTVVSDGPYRWVRHPSYTADILAFTGIGLALGNWLSLASAASLPLLGLLVRIHVEEEALLTNLGEPYRDFADDRKRLLPGIW